MFGPDDPQVARRHASISEEDGVLVLRDLDSHSGTFLEGHDIEEAELRHGDVFELGRGGPRVRIEMGDTGTLKMPRRRGGPTRAGGPAASPGPAAGPRRAHPPDVPLRHPRRLQPGAGRRGDPHRPGRGGGGLDARRPDGLRAAREGGAAGGGVRRHRPREHQRHAAERPAHLPRAAARRRRPPARDRGAGAAGDGAGHRAGTGTPGDDGGDPPLRGAGQADGWRCPPPRDGARDRDADRGPGPGLRTGPGLADREPPARPLHGRGAGPRRPGPRQQQRHVRGRAAHGPGRPGAGGPGGGRAVRAGRRGTVGPRGALAPPPRRHPEPGEAGRPRTGHLRRRTRDPGRRLPEPPRRLLHRDHRAVGSGQVHAPLRPHRRASRGEGRGPAQRGRPLPVVPTG